MGSNVVTCWRHELKWYKKGFILTGLSVDDKAIDPIPCTIAITDRQRQIEYTSWIKILINTFYSTFYIQWNYIDFAAKTLWL